MSKFKSAALCLSAGLIALSACRPPAPPPASEPAASAVQLNGTRVLSPTEIQFGVTPLSGTQAVGSAQISNPSVAFTTPAPGATATVCGQIAAQSTVTAAVTLDATGSMRDTDPNEDRAVAAKAFVSRLTGGSQAAVLSFSAGTPPSPGLIASVLHQGMTGDQARLNAAIDAATSASGSTNFYDAVIDAVKVAKDSGRPRPIVLALTDGLDNRSVNTAAQAIAAAKAQGVAVYAVGLDTPSNRLDFTQMERVASETGGLFRSNISSTDLNDYFGRLYNAFTAQGCVQLTFAAPPTPGTPLQGTLSLDVADTGKAKARLSVPFSYTPR